MEGQHGLLKIVTHNMSDHKIVMCIAKNVFNFTLRRVLTDDKSPPLRCVFTFHQNLSSLCVRGFISIMCVMYFSIYY